MLLIKNTITIVCVYLLSLLLCMSTYASDRITADFGIIPNLKEVLPLSIEVINELNESELKDLECIAWNLYFEARGGTKIEQVAVAYIPINRTKHSRFSLDICTNVFQYNYVNGRKFFQFVWAGYKPNKKWKIEHNTWLKVQEIAYNVYRQNIQDTAHGSIYFSHRTADWAPSIRKIPIGSHLFWKM